MERLNVTKHNGDYLPPWVRQKEVSNPMNDTNTVDVTADIATFVPAEPYYYLAGPMTGKPRFNFPEFIRVTALLRAAGWVICPPHEMEDNLIYHEATACETGETPHLASTSPLGFGLLRRDANIVMHPNCIGVIAMEGWEDSFGAGQIEVYLADRFRKETLLFVERADAQNGWVLEPLDYDKSMQAHEASQFLGGIPS